MTKRDKPKLIGYLKKKKKITRENKKEKYVSVCKSPFLWILSKQL